MSEMQMFYHQLAAAQKRPDGWLGALARLTRLGLDEIRKFRGELSWTDWSSAR